MCFLNPNAFLSNSTTFISNCYLYFLCYIDVIEIEMIVIQIYFINIMMDELQLQTSSRSDESIIINLAINIFQNVGIRRWIDQIQILKNQQIYFQICKIIFPQTMIHLFRLKENNKLTTGQKIQGVIDQIARLINNDLYHISGQAIAQGKLNHLKNFLQLLQALSNNMIVASKDHIEVQTAPQNYQSMTLDDHDSFYTVLGNFKQFQKIIYYSEEDQSQSQRPQRKTKNLKKDHGDRGILQQNQNKSSSSQQPIPQKYGNPQAKLKQSHQSKHPKYLKNIRKTPLFSSSSIEKKQPKAYPTPLIQKNQNSYEIKNARWVNLIKNMNQTKLGLQRQKMMKLQNEFIQWKNVQEENAKNIEKKINKQSNLRKKLINSKIEERQGLLQAFKGERPTIQIIKSIFKKQKVYRKQQIQKSKRREQQNIKQLMNFTQLEVLLKQAIISNDKRSQKISSHSNSEQGQEIY